MAKSQPRLAAALAAGLAIAGVQWLHCGPAAASPLGDVPAQAAESKSDTFRKRLPRALGGDAVAMLATALIISRMRSATNGTVPAASTADIPEQTHVSKVEAFRRFLPSALGGDATAQFEIGRTFVADALNAEDYTEAARWFRAAAEQGHPRAQSNLAVLYGKGLGVPQDYVRAYAWLDVAAAGFRYGARRDRVIEMRDMLAAFMTATQRDEARRLADAWKAKGLR